MKKKKKVNQIILPLLKTPGIQLQGIWPHSPPTVPTLPLLLHWPLSCCCSKLPSRASAPATPRPECPSPDSCVVVPHSLSDFISYGITLEGSLVILSKTSIPLDTQDVPLTIPLPNLTLSVLFHIFIYFAILQGMRELSSLTRDWTWAPCNRSAGLPPFHTFKFCFLFPL